MVSGRKSQLLIIIVKHKIRLFVVKGSDIAM